MAAVGFGIGRVQRLDEGANVTKGCKYAICVVRASASVLYTWPVSELRSDEQKVKPCWLRNPWLFLNGIGSIGNPFTPFTPSLFHPFTAHPILFLGIMKK
jgi:hypothetical protein